MNNTRVHATSETTLRLFQRALLPGPNGTLIEAQTALPAIQYFAVDAKSIDSFGHADSLDMELWGFFSLNLIQNESTPLFDGDIGSANARQRFGPVWVRAGRQLVAGGAARYARFDGASVGITLGEFRSHHARLEAYGGFTVLPRWNEQPGYHHLGSTQASLLRDPGTLAPVSRSGFLLGGTRASYSYARTLDASLSFHEQTREGELDRRNAGLAVRVFGSNELTLSGDAVLDLDSLSVADSRAFLDLKLSEQLDLSLEVLHTEPSLFLSRQSVLSVFSTSSFDEAGAELSYAPFRHLRITPYGYVERFPDDEYGARSGFVATADVDAAGTTRLLFGYGRVALRDGGYHTVRNALSRRLTQRARLLVEAYHYAYDRAIDGQPGSSVYAGNCSVNLGGGFDVLWGASLASTPYAESDLQTLARLRFSERYSFERTGWSAQSGERP